MTDADFNFLRLLLHQRSGLSLSPEKRYLAESRLGILCRRRNIADIATLIQKLRPGNDAALEHAVIEAMTTNETLFFRDHTPFDLFRDVILPERLAANAATRSLRIWCAAVSTGQEAYSLAMILDEMGPRLSGWKIQIVGTDISGEVLERARTGLYSQFEIQRGLPIQMLLKHFSQEGDRWRISERLRAMVDLRQHNLLEPNGHLGQFDIIFCRNVLIYFDVQTKARVLEALAPRLAPQGAMFLGAAETVIGISTTVLPDRQHRGVYRGQNCIHAQPAGLSLPREPVRAIAGGRF
ncbi:MAG: protein-glutamate O-methyltransferase CheR [Bosea sp. (in: a-proteobacteria)]|jgi:chemotaxis protein methyltransferase CheR|uniref:CheR family methyltransferase n=1 Tax=Bosea sp. (in: a-proteobacteria) TaxID=1871050 RepID=UPI001DB17D93|nr:protein-glutamate O-methyltransferase CheR [Bosea sp. (in: a-proteobacteria)]MBA4267933.1 chemotaxis protein CheR [Methylobacterium sp.]MCZ8043429.1 protein-glutamate O-methyltransferase CheR [Beijerinckiaceae bacterium]MDP3599858.1 protein-glutamate O-methyltransferase CheR [Bosea sp. (in: a-proteobacteria)]